MNIKVNNSWSVEGDNFNWTLHNWYDGKDKNGNHKRHSKELYYSSLSSALKVCCEKSLLGCESAEEIMDRLDKLNKEIVAALKAAGIDKPRRE